MKALNFVCLPALVSLLSAYAAGQVTTSQYDNARTGATLTETILTPTNVNAAHFGKVGAFRVDGPVFAQPLFVPALNIPSKGRHDVLFVVTEHDSVYAFDAQRPNDPPLWHVSFLDEKNGLTAVPAHDVHCPFIAPEIGITSTPVIDLSSAMLFVLARTKEGTQYFQRLHALALATGVEKLGGPKLIAASVPGKSDDAVHGQLKFDALQENPRAALLLTRGQIVLSWASSCDESPYHGWVMTYDAKTLQQTGVFNTTPNGREGGIWASDAGPSADAAGNIFVATGNGTFDADRGRRDYGDSELRLSLANGVLSVRDYFTPHDQAELDKKDWDFGSSGALLLPDQPGDHPHLLLQPTKNSMIYVIDRGHMGGFKTDKDAVVQEIKMPGEVYGFYGAIAYWRGHVFFAASDDQLRDYRVTDKGLEPSAVSRGLKFDNPGTTPSISANHDTNGVVWAIATRTWNGQERPAILYAFDANDISKPIYTSEQNSGRDRAALAARFAIPVVAKGHVYFATRGEVEMYGLLK